MYYSDEILEEIRSRNDIVDVIGSYVKLKKSGSTWFGLCPFHNEKTPSFSVTPSKEMFYCFGCHKGGSVIRFIQDYENYSFQEAVQMLAKRAGIALPEETQETDAQRARSRKKEQLLKIHKLAGTWYYYNLHSEAGKAGMSYLAGRGLSEEIIRRFGLGYAGKYADSLYRFLKEQGFNDELLSESGLMNRDPKKGLYDRFWNRIMFPIMDINNRIIGFGGRVMGDAKPKYLNSPESDIFNKRRNLYGLNIARKSREKTLILCEGYMDVISLHQAGFSNAVASLGTSLTTEHVTLLKRYTQEVILSYDSDDAGRNAALRAIPMLRDQGVAVRILRLSPYKDPDEFIAHEGSAALRGRFDQAQNAFMFEVEMISARYNHADPDERTRFLEQTAALIASFELQAQRENYMEAVCSEYRVSKEAMTQMVRKALMKTPALPPQSVYPAGLRQERRKKPAHEGLLQAQGLLLTWLTEYPSFYPVLKQYIGPSDFDGETDNACAAMLFEQLESGNLNVAAIIDSFEDEADCARAASLFHTRIDSENPEEIKKSMREAMRRVLSESGKRKSTSEGGGLEDIQSAIERSRQLEALKTLRIDLQEKQHVL